MTIRLKKVLALATLVAASGAVSGACADQSNRADGPDSAGGAGVPAAAGASTGEGGVAGAGGSAGRGHVTAGASGTPASVTAGGATGSSTSGTAGDVPAAGARGTPVAGAGGGAAAAAGSSSSSSAGIKGHAAAGGSAGAATVPLAELLESMVASGQLPKLDVGSTTAGPDTNTNGVRDDMDAIIAEQDDPAAGKAALTQMAKALQTALTADLDDAEAKARSSEVMARAVACIWSVYGRTQAADRVSMMEALTVNTMQRLAVYEAYNAAFNGEVTTFPTESVCDE